MQRLAVVKLCFAAFVMLNVATLGMFLPDAEEDEAGYGDGNRRRGFEFITEPLSSRSDETEQSRNLVAFTASEYPVPEIIKVTDKIYLAIGFALGSSIMVIGDDGIIIVDTTEATSSMAAIMTEFRNITTLPVKAIIFTHFHVDHITGTNYIIDEEKKTYPDQKIDVYAHELTEQFMNAWAETYDIGFTRGVRQVGPFIPVDPNAVTGAGLGRSVIVNADAEWYVPKVTVTFKDRASYTVAGVNFELIHAPGETDDQLCVWLPKERISMPGDNIYKMFPNIYAIRGSPTRDAKQWYQSIDKIRALGSRIMVPSHTRPIHGEHAIYDTFTVYRDGIKFVHDQTVRLMDKGVLPGDIVQAVTLPDSVKAHPYMQEYYGAVGWSVRGIFDHYIGWFSGDPVDLDPMPAQDRAARVLELVDRVRGRDGPISDLELLLRQAQRSLVRSHNNYVKNGEYIGSDDKWALELANTVVKIGSEDTKLMDAAKVIQHSALTALGVSSVSPNGRNYYLTYSIELGGVVVARSAKSRAFAIQSSTLEAVLTTFSLGSNGLICQHQNLTLVFDFTDVGQRFGLTLRNSVCDVITDVDDDEKPSVSLSLASQTFRDVMKQESTMAAEVESGSVVVNEGTVATYDAFMECFEPMI